MPNRKILVAIAPATNSVANSMVNRPLAAGQCEVARSFSVVVAVPTDLVRFGRSISRAIRSHRNHWQSRHHPTVYLCHEIAPIRVSPAFLAGALLPHRVQQIRQPSARLFNPKVVCPINSTAASSYWAATSTGLPNVSTRWSKTSWIDLTRA